MICLKKEENGLLFIWIVSAVATLGSLYFSEIRHYEPCKLCWIQRIFYVPDCHYGHCSLYTKKMLVLLLQQRFFSVIGGCISLYHYGIQKLSFFSG
ncbi:disulfide bond formation protein B [Lysinibacillus sp. MHQ-1]|nr:disulfide bond formation protein B [Lysinibacillus sp. MHQ-1]